MWVRSLGAGCIVRVDVLDAGVGTGQECEVRVLNSRGVSVCWDGAALVTIEPAHVVRGVVLLLVATERVPFLVVDANASTLLAQGWSNRSLSSWSASKHAVDGVVASVVRRIEGNALLWIVECDRLRCVEAALYVPSNIGLMMRTHRGAGLDGGLRATDRRGVSVGAHLCP